MKVVKKKLADLVSPEKNLRLHTENQIVEFKRSVEMFGQIRPIVIDENNVMLAGNGLHQTLTELGWTEADCHVVTGLSETQKKKLMLADNRIFDLGVDDMAAFDEFILDLQGDLDIPGFDEDMLKSFVLDTKEVDDLLSDYGSITDEKADEIANMRKKYDKRDEDAKESAVEHKTGEVPDEIRAELGFDEAYQAENGNRGYILCPKCEGTIWL